MALYITSLNSGSNGNCYYIGNENEAILIDAGISCREIEKRMKRLRLTMQKVKAVFISHEHSDHVKGITALVRKYQIPAYITSPTLFYSGCNIDNRLAVPFVADEPIVIGDLTTIAFSKLHDASDPYSFVVMYDGVKVGIFTDIGAPCQQLIKHFKECHAAFLEANYDCEMLEKGNYPYFLKKRIRGGKGHLSNQQALELFRKYKPAFMSHLFLSHISENNNCPHIVKQLFEEYSNGVKIIVASRFEETALYSISKLENQNLKQTKQKFLSQLSFSFE